MKVYVVTLWTPYEADTMVGICSTKTKADVLLASCRTKSSFYKYHHNGTSHEEGSVDEYEVQ